MAHELYNEMHGKLNYIIEYEDEGYYSVMERLPDYGALQFKLFDTEEMAYEHLKKLINKE